MGILDNPTTQSGVIQGVGSAFGGAIGYLNSRKQFEEQKELMDKSMAQSIEMWNLQNAYMTPKAQMQRLADAGLNPDLIYGKLQDTSGSMPSVNTPQAPDVAGAVSQGAMAASQIRLQDSLAQKNASETKYTNSQNDFYLKSFDTRFNLLTEQYHLTQDERMELSAVTDYYKQSANLLVTQNEYFKNLSYKEAYNALSAEKDYQNYDTRFNALMQDIKQRYRLNGANAYKVEREARMFVELWNVHKEHALLQNANLRSQNALNASMASYYDAESAYINQKTFYLPFDFVDDMIKGQQFFEKDEQGNVVLDKHGIPKINKTKSGINYGMSIAGDVLSMAGDVVGMVLPWHFLKQGFTVGGAKSATNSLSKGHMPSARSERPTSGFSTNHSSEYYQVYGEMQRASARGDTKEYQRLYKKLLHMK